MQLEVAETRQGDDQLDPRVRRTRKRVLEATCALLAESGIELTTVQAIASRSGVNKTTIYRNWPEPNTLIREAIARMTFDDHLPDLASVSDELTSMFTSVAHSLQQSPWNRLVPSVIGACATDPGMRALHGELTRRRRDAATTVIARAVDRGELDAETPPKHVIDVIIGPIYYRIFITMEHVTDADVAALVEHALVPYRPTRQS